MLAALFIPKRKKAAQWREYQWPDSLTTRQIKRASGCRLSIFGMARITALKGEIGRSITEKVRLQDIERILSSGMDDGHFTRLAILHEPAGAGLDKWSRRHIAFGGGEGIHVEESLHRVNGLRCEKILDLNSFRPMGKKVLASLIYSYVDTYGDSIA